MSEPKGIDFEEYHTKAVAAFAAFLGTTVDVVAAYPRFEDKTPKRAVCIELDGITPASPDDLGTGQFNGQARFVANVFVSYKVKNPELAVRLLATRLVTFIHGERFGCPVGPAQIIIASPDGLLLPGKTGRDGEAEDVECWRVEWSHECLMGQSVWNNDGVEPVEVWTNGEQLTPSEE